MTFYEPSDTQFTRLQRDEVDMALWAIDCALCGEQAIYASTELTSGSRLYDALRRTGMKSAAELKEKSKSDWTTSVWDPNMAAALEFAQTVRRRHDYRTPVVTPAPYAAGDWKQPEYLALWERLLRTRIKAAWFNRNWYFSDGCTFEFAVAVDAGMPTLDHEGRALDVDAATGLIADAIRVLAAQDFDTASLRRNLGRIGSARTTVL